MRHPGFQGKQGHIECRVIDANVARKLLPELRRRNADSSGIALHRDDWTGTEARPFFTAGTDPVAPERQQDDAVAGQMNPAAPLRSTAGRLINREISGKRFLNRLIRLGLPEDARSAIANEDGEAKLL